MAYSDDISNLGANHHWAFDGNSNDAIGSANGTDTSIVYTDNAIAEDATNCATTNATGDRISIPSTSDINSSAQTRWAFGGWFATTKIQEPPKSIAGRGDDTDAIRFILFLGNNIMVEADPGGSDQILQVYGSTFLADNRSYHLFARWSGSGYDNLFDFFLDGVKLTNAQPVDRQPDITSFPATTVLEFGDPVGTVSVGGTAVLLNAPVNGKYQHWCTFSDSDIPTDTEIREILFERGALADVTISSDTEANMQTALDAYADTTRDDAPCCIEIEAVSGGGNFTLNLDNIKFDAKAAIHVRYNGTSGTLTLRNTNGAACSIVSAPFGGSIELYTEVTVTVTVKDASTKDNIQGARVLLETDPGGDTVIDKVLTNALGQVTTTYDHASDQAVVGVVRKHSSSPYYRQGEISGTITSSGLSTTILLVQDE